jgi:hypothetical protein
MQSTFQRFLDEALATVSTPTMSKLILASLSLLTLCTGGTARAETIQAPEGARAFPLGSDRVICGAVPDGWSMSNDRHQVRPPDKPNAMNRSVDVRVAADLDGCTHNPSTLTLIATGPAPNLDPSSVSFYPDEGRLELNGSQLEQSQIGWQSGERMGRETCLTPTMVGKIQHCSVPLERKLPIKTELRLLPAYAAFGPDVTTYDAKGLPLDAPGILIRPVRVVLAQVFGSNENLDVSQGFGVVPLLHPLAVASADCGGAHCELTDDGIVVRAISPVATQITISVRLGVRFSISRNGKSETTSSATFALLRCPVEVVSGPPMRNMDETEILVKMPDRCQSNAKLRWSLGADTVEAIREVREGETDYVLLRTGQVIGSRVTITASRADALGGVVAVTSTATQSAKRPQSTLDLPGFGPINFIPTNREAVWSLGGVPQLHAVPLDLPGVYTIREDHGRTYIRGDQNGGGFVSLRYAFRRDDLPKGFADANLAVQTESVQRPLREASVPVSFTTSSNRKEPLAEFLCADAKGNPVALVPGKPAQIPYSARETCHVVIHQERLRPEDGQQEVVLEVEVTSPSGGKRSDASINEHLVLRHDGQPRMFYLKGIVAQFDHVTVRLSHVVDETRYVLGPSAKQSPPSVQWSATVEGGRTRLYVSLSIPAGLYRINEPAASLTLNFGVLGRITWLSREGKEGLLGLETGVLGASLIPQQIEGNPAFPPTLVTLLGLGLRVEVGQGAAVGVHLWGAYEFRSRYQYTGGDGSSHVASHWSLLFGPSISIGNVGTNL